MGGVNQSSMFAPHDLAFRRGTIGEANALLAPNHYLGATRAALHVFIGEAEGCIAACMTWRLPAARMLPNDGTWLELSRWCLTPIAGKNAGSRMHRFAIRDLRRSAPDVTTLVSYSDPSAGHTGALYRACNWEWRPTWHRLRPPPSGNGAWTAAKRESVKDRWVFELRRDPRRDGVLAIKDEAIAKRIAAAAS